MTFKEHQKEGHSIVEGVSVPHLDKSDPRIKKVYDSFTAETKEGNQSATMDAQTEEAKIEEPTCPEGQFDFTKYTDVIESPD